MRKGEGAFVITYKCPKCGKVSERSTCGQCGERTNAESVRWLQPRTHRNVPGVYRRAQGAPGNQYGVHRPVHPWRGRAGQR